MKTELLQTKELLVWIVLVCSIALFTVSFSFAQEKGKGTYFLKITQGDDSITKKLVVE